MGRHCSLDPLQGQSLNFLGSGREKFCKGSGTVPGSVSEILQGLRKSDSQWHKHWLQALLRTLLARAWFFHTVKFAMYSRVDLPTCFPGRIFLLFLHGKNCRSENTDGPEKKEENSQTVDFTMDLGEEVSFIHSYIYIYQYHVACSEPVCPVRREISGQSEVLGEVSVLEGGSSGRSLSRSFWVFCWDIQSKQKPLEKFQGNNSWEFLQGDPC